MVAAVTVRRFFCAWIRSGGCLYNNSLRISSVSSETKLGHRQMSFLLDKFLSLCLPLKLIQGGVARREHFPGKYGLQNELMKTEQALQIILTLGTAILGTTIQAQTTIDTTTSWNGSVGITPFGLPNTATYGQTITCPALDTILTSFSFEMNLPATCTFNGYVYAWNGSEASGGALYTSGITSTAGTGYQLVTFNTGNLNLTAGSSYVLFGSVSGIPTSTGTGYWGEIGRDVYSGGNQVWINNGINPSLWTTTPWEPTFADGDDMAFKATFVSPVPEPSVFALAGLVGLSLLGFRRRK